MHYSREPKVNNMIQSQFDLLKQAYQNNRLSHAYLLSGLAGLGKTDCAKAFARFLLCENNSENTCHCRSCKQFHAGTHPDMIFIEPAEKSHAIKIDQIRALTQTLSCTAHAGGYQAVIISPADAMPEAAANALLKTLEEPAGRVIMLLIDHGVHPLPLTIASRCQKIYFYQEAVSALVKNHDAALQQQFLTHLMQLSDHRADPIAPVVHWLKQDILTMLDILLLLCFDIARIQFKASIDQLIHFSHHAALMFLSQKITPISLQQFIIVVLEKKAMLVKGINLNTQLCLENIFIEWEKYVY